MQATTIADFLSVTLRLTTVPSHGKANPERHEQVVEARQRWENPRHDQHSLEDLNRLRMDERVRSLLR